MQAYWLSLLYEEELGLHKENLCGFFWVYKECRESVLLSKIYPNCCTFPTGWEGGGFLSSSSSPALGTLSRDISLSLSCRDATWSLRREQNLSFTCRVEKREREREKERERELNDFLPHYTSVWGTALRGTVSIKSRYSFISSTFLVTSASLKFQTMTNTPNHDSLVY